MISPRLRFIIESPRALMELKTMTQTPDIQDKSPSTTQTTEHASQIRQARIDKLDAWRQKGMNPYSYHFQKTESHADLQTKYQALDNGIDTEDKVSVAGRVMALRNSGMFIDLQDP